MFVSNPLNPGGGIYEGENFYFSALVAFTVFKPFCLEITQSGLLDSGENK